MVEHNHFQLWSDFKKHILSIFNAPSINEQPKIIVEFGCGDGLLLQQIYLFIREHSLCSNVLDEQELRLVGIEQCPDLIQAATRNLADIPADIISMPLNRPEEILRQLNGRITADKQDILFIQSCHVNHQESDLTDIRTECVKQMLTGWSSIVGRHGLLICNETVAKTSDVSAESFLILAANVGLFPASQLISYPTDTWVTHFQKADYSIRHTRLSDLPALVQLEQECWPIKLQATSTNLVDRLNNYPEGQFLHQKHLPLNFECQASSSVPNSPQGGNFQRFEQLLRVQPILD